MADLLSVVVAINDVITRIERLEPGLEPIHSMLCGVFIPKYVTIFLQFKFYFYCICCLDLKIRCTNLQSISSHFNSLLGHFDRITLFITRFRGVRTNFGTEIFLPMQTVYTEPCKLWSSTVYTSPITFLPVSIGIDHFHIDHNAPCSSPNTLHNHCFRFLLGRL